MVCVVGLEGIGSFSATKSGCVSQWYDYICWMIRCSSARLDGWTLASSLSLVAIVETETGGAAGRCRLISHGWCYLEFWNRLNLMRSKLTLTVSHVRRGLGIWDRANLLAVTNANTRDLWDDCKRGLNRVWTSDRLATRGWPNNIRCPSVKRWVNWRSISSPSVVTPEESGGS